MNVRGVFSGLGAAAATVLASSSAAQTISFAAPQHYDLSILGAVSPGIAVGDLDRDGMPDVVAAGTGLALVYLGRADGTLALPVQYQTGAGTTVVLGDVNSDGALDVLVGPSGITVLLGRGDGTLSPPVTSSGYFIDPDLADFNGDGRLDVVSIGDNTTAGPPETVDVYFGKGDGTFGAFNTIALTDLNPREVTAVQLDGDGLPDLVFRQADTRFLSLYLNNGDGTFRAVNVNQAFTQPSVGDIAIADLDRSSTSDVIVAGGSATVSVFFGSGDGSVQPMRSYDIPGCTTSCGAMTVTTGDVNGDGWPDVVAGSGAPGAVTVFTNSGGVLSLAASLTTRRLAHHVASDDFNGDGRSDIVYAHSDSAIGSAQPSVLSIALAVPDQTNGGGAGGGTPVSWTGLINVTVQGTVLAKTAGCDGCFDASGRAGTELDGDGFVEFTVPNPSAIALAGLARLSAATDPTDVDFGLLLQGGGWMEVRERGLYRTDVPVVAGDVFRIAVDAGVVTYVKNGAVFHTSTAAAPLPLEFVALLATSDATLADVSTLGFTEGGAVATADVKWIDRVHVTLAGSRLTKSAGCEGCFDAGASSGQQLWDGTGSLEFVCDDTGVLLAIGLTHVFTGTNPADIAYGLRVQGGGWVEVRERGMYRADVASRPGDVFRISVASGLVTYARNGAVFHTSVVGAVPPLFAAATFATIGGSISGARIED
jgi:hypothetical protein